ncbi:hypothetical protein ACKEWD_17280, partial [Yersinia enterocolitica]
RRRKPIPGGSTRAIPGADALLFYLSSPCKIESSRFVSSLNLFIVILVKKPIELVSGSEI